jgi:hypothetical protein
MPATPNFLAQLLGAALYKVQADPDLRQLGKGLGLSFDLARNAPVGLTSNVAHYQSEETR